MSRELNKNVWITGASSGIGKAATLEFARAGANVFISSRRKVELEKINKELSAKKLNVNILPLDISSNVDVRKVANKIISKNKINCLVNNAGITSFKTAEQNTIEEINEIINTNLLGSIYAIKAVLPQMIANKSGTIINVLSVVTKKIFTHSAIYSASKMGLLGFSNSLREEVRKYNIRVINISPGATDTSMWSKKIRSEKSKRMISPDEVAKIILWAYNRQEKIVTEEILIRPIEGDL